MGLTIHSSRRRFAARLNSGVRPMPKFVRYLCIAFVITVLAIPVAWFAVQRTEAFAVASTHAKNSTDIRSRLGEIQDVDLPFLGYSVHVAGASGDAKTSP